MNLRSEWHIDGNSVSDMSYSKSETIDSVKSNFDIRRFNSAEGYTVTIGGVEVQVIIQDHANPINESDVDKKLLIPIDFNAHTGDYVIYKGDTWIINSKVNIVDDGYKICQMQLCTYTLKFQSPTGTILSYPCIDSATSSVGIDENNIISTLSGIHRIKLPFDENTKLIGVGKRFFLDKVGTTTYKTTNVNNTSYNYGDKGLIELTLQQDSAYNVQTDINGVCDYKEPTITPPTPDPTIPTEIVTITSDTVNNNIKLGLLYTFSATFTNELGVDINNVVAEYSVDNMYGGKVMLTDNGDGTCTVKVGSYKDTQLCTKQFVLTCMDVINNYSSSIVLTIVGMF